MPTLYLIDGCIKCYRAKRHLKSIAIDFDEINILDEPDKSKRLVHLIGEVYVPVLVNDQQILKGEAIEKLQAHDLNM